MIRLERSDVRLYLGGVLVLIGLLLGLLYYPVFRQFVTDWATYSEYNYAFLVPAVSVFLIWRRREALRHEGLRPDGRAAGVLVASLGIYVLGIATGVHVVQGLSFIPVTLSLVWFVWGQRAARILAFPVGYLACGLGLFRGLASSVGFAMQGLTAQHADELALVLGAHVQRDGLLLTMGHYQFIVAESCSGLGSLLSLLALGWLVVGESTGPLRSKIVLCAAIVPLVLLANIVRVALVLVIAQDISPIIAEGFVHYAFSVVIFAVTLLLLLALRKALQWYDHIGSASLLPLS